METFWTIFAVTGIGGFTIGNLVMNAIGIAFIADILVTPSLITIGWRKRQRHP